MGSIFSVFISAETGILLVVLIGSIFFVFISAETGILLVVLIGSIFSVCISAEPEILLVLSIGSIFSVNDLLKLLSQAIRAVKVTKSNNDKKYLWCINDLKFHLIA
jgi:hypothetical protein